MRKQSAKIELIKLDSLSPARIPNSFKNLLRDDSKDLNENTGERA